MRKFLVLIASMIAVSCSSQPKRFFASITCYSGGVIFFSDVFDASKAISFTSYEKDDGSKIYLNGDCITIVNEE